MVPRILIADDDLDTRQILTDWLTHQGYETFAVADGREALTLAETHALDLALLDVVMPGPSGMDLAARLRDRHPQLGVIIITAYGTIPDAVEAMKAGALNYLTKPLRMRQVSAVVEEALAAARMPESDTDRSPAHTGDVSLSPRQSQVLRLMGQGLTNRQIAAELGLSPKTVGNYVGAILRALSVRNRTAAVLRAQELGLL